MSARDLVHRLVHGTEETFDSLVDKLMKKKGWDEPVHVLPYRGFGTEDEVWVKGRVLENETEPPDGSDTLWDNMVRMFKRYESDELPHAKVKVSAGAESAGDDAHDVESDEEGYVELRLKPPSVSASGDSEDGGLYRKIHFQLAEPLPTGVDEARESVGEVIVPGPDARFLVVSDMDDTVIKTGASDLLRMSRAIFLNNARTRMPFPGVAPFYRALAQEPERGRNPFAYVSSSPWNLYELFDEFLSQNDVPRGPILLKDFGVSEEKLGKSGHTDHKTEWIETFLETWPDLPLILIGDSGQKDASIYRDAVLSAPDRFLAVYIRDVTGDGRDEEVLEMCREVEDAGVPMLLVDDSLEAARHAAENGWIDDSALDEIREACEADRAEPTWLERMLGKDSKDESVNLGETSV